MCPGQIEMIDVLDYGRRPRFRNGGAFDSAVDAMAVCPGISLTRLPKPAGQLGDQAFFDAWGPVLGVWEGYAADPQIRYAGASGGVATALGLFSMERLGMSGTQHIRSREDISYLNKTVFSRTREELLTGAASRYAPASPCDTFEMISQSESPCVFVGKPCDVAAVRNAADLRQELNKQIGLSVAFFCAGTPSLAGTLEMLRQMGVEDPSSVDSLRYRGGGWPGNAVVVFRDKTGSRQTREFTYEQSWGDILQKYRQWRCYICPDHIGEYADIAVADAWHQDIVKHQPGLSVLIARTERGKEILEQAIAQDYIKAELVSPDILPLCRPGQAAYQAELCARIRTLKAVGVPTPDYPGFDLYRLWQSELSVKEKIRAVLSTVKRVFIKQLLKPRKMEPYSPSRNSKLRIPEVVQ